MVHSVNTHCVHNVQWTHTEHCVFSFHTMTFLILSTEKFVICKKNVLAFFQPAEWQSAAAGDGGAVPYGKLKSIWSLPLQLIKKITCKNSTVNLSDLIF